MPRKKWLILLILLLAGLYVLFTGGVTVVHNRGFGGQRDLDIHPEVDADIWLPPQFNEFSIPLLFHRYSSDLPCSVRLQLRDRQQKYTSIHVDKVTIEYRDGPVKSYPLDWNGSLKPHTQVNSSSGGIVRTEMLRLSDKLPVLIQNHDDVQVNLSGYLFTEDGRKVTFTTASDFEASEYTEWMTFWEHLARI
jgi:hypothetical protein